jgi:hypothetical protein
MRWSRNVLSLGAGCLLLAAGALAADTNKHTLHLYDTVTVQGKQLAPGDYKVEWNGQGPNVDLTIDKGKKTVLSVPAQVTPVTEKQDQDGYVAKNEGGQNVLSEIFFHGKDYELKLADQGSSPAPSARGNNR